MVPEPDSPPSTRTSTLVLRAGEGRIIGGKYELVRRLGSGSMGEVWVARHRSLNETVALKLLATAPPAADVETVEVAAARFRLEAQIAAHLSRRTRHIVRVTDHGEEAALAYLVMELLEGQTLQDHLLRRGRMAPARVARVVAQIARGLDQAHSEGVVHRDLKPANIFLARDEDGADLVKILDFGIARLMPTHRASGFSTAPNVIFGTPGYMSPEHALGFGAPDLQYDLWALATVAYEALTEELPIPGVSTGELLQNVRARRIVPIHDLAPDLPAGLGAFFVRAFAERVEARFASASDLAQALGRAVHGEGAAATASEARRRPRRRRAALGIVAMALGLVAWVVLAGRATTVHATRPDGPSIQRGEAEPLEPLPPASTQPMALENAPGPDATTPPVASKPPLLAPVRGLAASASGCNPPFEIDSLGIKRWKLACL